MKIRLVDIFELLTYLTTTTNLLLESNILCFINIFVVMIFVILVMYEMNKKNKEDKEEE